MGKAVLSVLVTVGLTAPSLAQEPVLSNDGMLWEGEAAAAANELDQDRVVLALDAARNLSEHSQLILPEPDADEIARRMAPTDDADRQAQQTGFTRTVAGFAQLAPSPAGTQRSSDGQDYVVSQRLVGSTGAVSMRLHFADVHLPPGAWLHVYGLVDDGDQHSTRHNTRQMGYDSTWLGDRTSFWSHTIPGDRAVVEYHPPPPEKNGATSEPNHSYTVDRVVHDVVDIFGHHDGATGAAAAACHLDMCDNPAWRETGNGVVRLRFIRRNGGSAFCSGALLNDRARSGTPYIYTANHCISTQSVASTVEIEYFYQRNQCSDNPTDNAVRHLGSMLLATAGGINDHTLLQANTPPPSGAALLGWNAGGIAVGTPVTGIHHPVRDFKRISFGNKTADQGGAHTITLGDVHAVTFSRGIIESGSSGSPLIINGPHRNSVQVIGTLCRAHSSHSCSNPQLPVYYCKLSRVWSSFSRYLTNTLPADLIVDSVSVSDATPEPGAAFTLNATVRNRGTQVAAATRLRYYRSADDTISTDDTELTTDSVGVLAINGSSSQNAQVSIANTGSYWVGACVEPVSSETATANNCSSGVRLDVNHPQPDLIIASVTVSDATPEPSASFTINARARNQGGEASAATTLRYYLSADDTISTTDTELTTDEVGGLAADAISEQSAAVSIADAGEYWVGACIDPVDGETARANCSQSVRVSVVGADLTIDSVSVSDATPVTGIPFTINATVRNRGTKVAAATTLRYYLSADDTVTTDDTELTTDSVGVLAINGSSSQNAEVSIANTGSYWVGACVEPVSSETETANNCSPGVRLDVNPRRPDLIIAKITVSDAAPESGASLTINARARNRGTRVAAATTLRYYLSADDAIRTTDTELTTDEVGTLVAGATSEQNATISIAESGEYWVGACIDPVAGETARANCSQSVRVSVAGADLTIDSVSVSAASVETGAPFMINATVRNRGTRAAAATTLRYYRSSTDNTISTADTELATTSVGALAADATSEQNATVSIPGTTRGWRGWVGVCVDGVADETTANNCSTGVAVIVIGPPDLVVLEVTVSNATPEPGTSFMITTSAVNRSTGAASATTLRYYRSADARITPTDTELATASVGALAAISQSPQKNVTVSIPDAGRYWVGACVDPVNGEVARTNNCTGGVRVSVTAPPVVVPTLPDLTVDTVSVSDASVETGATFTINATARNSGDRAAAATTLFYYRSDDSTITANDTQLATDPISGLSAGGSSSQNAAVSIANTGNWWIGACVGPVNGEVARNNNCSTGVEVNVTAVTAPPVPAPTLPDMTVTNVNVSDATPEPGASFTINATVGNSGNGTAAATTLRYYRSTNATITTTDTPLTTDAVGALAANRTSQQSAAVSIPNTGTWWVGACVDPVSSETARDNNCSSGVEVRITAPAPTLPDLTVDSVSVSASTVESDVSFTINATVRNSGDGASPRTTLRYFRSDDSTITDTDTELTTDAVGGLAPGGASQESATVSITDVGSYWVGACVSTVDGETETGNNCSDGVEVTVTALPDLTVDGVSVAESSVETGAAFTINATVQNTGTGAATASTLFYYLSDDALITVADAELASKSVEALAADTSSQQSAEVLIADAGTYWVGACVAEVSDETATENNCSAGVQITVTVPPNNSGSVLTAIMQLLL